MKRPLILLSFLLLFSASPTMAQQATPTPQCMTISSGDVCYFSLTVDTPTPTVTPTTLPTATQTPVPTAAALNSQVEFTLYRNSQHALVGSTSSATWLFPGTAATSSTFLLFSSLLDERQVIWARWVLAWNPNTGATPTNVRLIYFDGTGEITQFAKITGTNYHTPRVDAVIVTGFIQALINGGIDKSIGMQTLGNGTNGPLIYGSWIEVVWR
jgi:hypothetical protein